MSPAPTQTAPTRSAPTQTASTQTAPTPIPRHVDTARPGAAQSEAPHDPLAAEGRLREATLERPHTVANPRRVRVL